ncbi:MAG: winged helix-turn-helix transcriptional regulator [Polymorphobacter sp.]
MLATLQRGTPARVPVLASSLGASRGGVAEALDALVELGLLARTPPPRHPLQPELVLTNLGARLAAAADDLARVIDDLAVAPLLRNRWALPVIASLQTPLRFGALRRALPEATDRALAMSLSGLVDAALITREVLPAFRPPATSYALLPSARPLAAILHNSPLGQSALPG